MNGCGDEGPDAGDRHRDDRDRPRQTVTLTVTGATRVRCQVTVEGLEDLGMTLKTLDRRRRTRWWPA